MAHALAAHPAVGDLDPAAVADHPLVLHPAILAAGALPVLLGSEDALAEQAILLGPIRPIVNRLGLLDLAERPAANVKCRIQADAHRPVVVDAIVVDFTGTHRVYSLSKGSRGRSGFRLRRRRKASLTLCPWVEGLGEASGSNPLLFQLHVEPEAADFVSEHVETRRGTRFKRVFPLDHGLVYLCPA